ncbi:unnamed protein product [Parnassius apollo]|uniref:(apollo) hypothetical protein n=1 Tax=Parnassius apollo TaxID=110799 RepID=A0A8S3VXV7_PARAO|nr:unnamed protein product [Parnassius apollo]
MVEQPANVDAAVNTPVVVDSNDDGTVAQELELEHMRSTLEEAIVETRSTTLENRPRLPRIALSKRNRAVDGVCWDKCQFVPAGYNVKTAASWGKRIRRYTERSTRFNQNRLFQSDQKRLYASLERPIVSGTGPAPNQAALSILARPVVRARKPQRGPLDGSCGESVCGYYAHGPRHHNTG